MMINYSVEMAFDLILASVVLTIVSPDDLLFRSSVTPAQYMGLDSVMTS